jgi:protein SCO1
VFWKYLIEVGRLVLIAVYLVFFSLLSYPELKNRTSAVKPGQSVGTAAIGGPFKLLNHDGKPITEKDFFGKWTLLYFGFTHCPDICPDELQKMAAAIDKISKSI